MGCVTAVCWAGVRPSSGPPTPNWTLLYVTRDRLPQATEDFLRSQCSRIGKAWLAGGTAVISDAVESAIESALHSCRPPGDDPAPRLAGQTRYDTAQTVAKQLFADPAGAIVATGDNWRDGVAGGQLSAISRDLPAGSREPWPLLLTPAPKGGDPPLHPATEQYLTSDQPGVSHSYLLGGRRATGRNAYTDLDAATRAS